VGFAARDRVEHGESRDDGQRAEYEDGGFDAQALRGPGAEQDDDELGEAKGDVEQGGGVFVEAEAVEDQGAEGVGDPGADIKKEGQSDPEVSLGFEGQLEEVGGFELARAGAGLVGAQAFDGFWFVRFGEEACGGDVVVEVPVDEGDGSDGYEADEEEDAVIQILAK